MAGKKSKPKRLRVQFPMHAKTYDAWRRASGARLEREARRRAAAEADSPDRSTASEHMLDLLQFFEMDKIVLVALAEHVRHFAESANAEAGFDIGIAFEEVVIGEQNGYTIPFATIDAAAAVRLLDRGQVRQDLLRMLDARGAKRRNYYVGREIQDCDEELLMDLLTVSLPDTIRVLGGVVPADLVGPAIDLGLQHLDARRSSSTSPADADMAATGKPKRHMNASRKRR